MTAPVKTAAEWQALLDERFPEGAIVTRVLKDGTLAANPVYRVPVLVVMAMRGEWPLIVGIDADGRDLQLHAASWEEIDRSGHFVARVKMAPVSGAVPGEYEINSWLSPNLVAALAQVRDAQREWLLQVAQSAEEETQLEVSEPADEDSEAAPGAPVTEDMTLTMRRVDS
jgi:hypothetical protein